jgi:hypothetical protein
MAQIQSAGTCFSDGVRTGPLFQDQEGRLAAPYVNFGPGMAYSTQYSYFFTPFPAPTGTAATGIPAFDVVASTTLNNSATPTPSYLSISNSDYPLSTQFVSASTGRVGLQLDVPRCVGVSVGDAPGADIVINIIGKDLYGFPMLEKIKILSVTADTTIIGNKAFYQIDDVWCSGNGGNAPTDIGVRTTNKFGLPYRLYSGGNAISLGGGYQAVDDTETVQAAVVSTEDMNACLKQGYFYNLTDIASGALPLVGQNYYTGGLTHYSSALDVRGTLDLTDNDAFVWETNLPSSVCFTYVVLGFDNSLSRLYEMRDRYNYAAQGTPNYDLIYPNFLPILPNVAFDYPAGSYDDGAGKANIPEKLPLNLTTAFGVPQFYTEARGDV